MKMKKKKKKIGVIFLVLAIVFNSSGCFSKIFGNRNRTESSLTESVYSGDDIQELVGYFDQSKKTISDGFKRIEGMVTDESFSSSDNAVQCCKQCIDIVEEIDSDLQSLEKKAFSINGLDDKLKNVREQYFNVCTAGLNSTSEVYNFLLEFMSFYYNTLLVMPTPDNDDSALDFGNAISGWYTSAKAEVEKMNCPSCLQSLWDDLTETLDLNNTIIEKLSISSKYNDNLRLRSAINLCIRYVTSIENKSMNLLNRAGDQEEFADELINFSDSIVNETKEYSKLDQKDREIYEFENDATGKLYFKYENIDTIYPALYSTYDSICYIGVGCFAGNKKIMVEAEIPGLTQKYSETFELEPSFTTLSIKPPFITEGLDLTSAKEAQLNIKISETDGTVIESKTCPITIKSKYDVEWTSDEYGTLTKDNILCFLDPESEEISNLKRLAIEEISSVTNGKVSSFKGYQQTYGPYVDTYLQAAGIMRALYDMGVRYNADSYSISGSNQHILFPDDVLRQKSGLCIETSLVVASALMSANMHVFLIFPPGHAQVAVEVWNNGKGAGEYFLIETTALTESSNNQKIFADGVTTLSKDEPLNGMVKYFNNDHWARYLNKEGTYIIDCNDINILGMAPISN